MATRIPLLLVLSMLLAAPLWLTTHPPVQTAPLVLDIESPTPVFTEITILTVPSGSAVDALQTGLAQFTGDAVLAGAIVAMLCGALWIGAAVAVSRTETDRPVLPALLLLPLGFVAIGQGIHDVVLGLPVFLLFTAYWRRLDERRDFVVLGGTALFLSALALTHVAAFAAAGLLLTADSLERAVAARRRFDLATAGRLFVLDAVWMAVAALPCLLLVFGVLPGSLGGLDGIARAIPEPAAPFGFAGWAIAMLPPVLGALAVAGGAILRRADSDDLLWPICLAMTVCVSACLLATPAAPLGARLVPFAWIALVLTFAKRRDDAARVPDNRPAVPAKDVASSAVPDLVSGHETSPHVSA